VSKIDIVLINPSNKKQMYGELGDSLAGIEPPLWIALLAAFLRDAGFSVAIIDAEAEGFGLAETLERIISYSPLVVGIGVIGANPSASSTPKMPAAHSLLTLIRDRNLSIKTFLYGIHPSALPERTLQEEPVDFVLQGEAFYPAKQLLSKLKKQGGGPFNIKGLWYKNDGQIICGGWADIVTNLDDLPMPAWDLLPMDEYRAHNWHCFGHINERSPYAIIYTSLGCPFNCSYCNIHALYDGKPGIRFRSPDKVLEEIDLLVNKYKVKNLKILDELFVIEGERLEKICDMLIQRNYGINIWGYARVDTVNERILRKLRKAGINWLCYGIEAGSRTVRQGVAKGRFEEETIRRAAQMTHDAGIAIIGNFMFGLPDDNLQTMEETFALAQELNCEYVNFYTTMAYPGSKLYEEAVASGRKLPEDWIGYSQFSPEILPLATKYISSADVLSFRDNAFVKYYKNPRYLKIIEEKFGKETVDHIYQMLTYKIKRNILKKGTSK